MENDVRLRAWQHIGYAYFLLGAVGQYASIPARDAAEVDAWELGNRGIHPDADAFALGRESVLSVVQHFYDEETNCSHSAAVLEAILAACNDTTPATDAPTELEFVDGSMGATDASLYPREAAFSPDDGVIHADRWQPPTPPATDAATTEGG